MKAGAIAIGLLAAVVLAATPSGGGAAGPARIGMLGVVPHEGEAANALGALASTSHGNLVLHTQPCTLASSCWVMRTNTTYAIYWIPSGSAACGGAPCDVSTHYEALIDQYLTDVAAARGSTSDVYSTATQYYDATGPIEDESTFGGSYVDTDPFPPSGCVAGSDPVCLTKQQIEDELQRVLAANGWHGGTTSLFFVMTPDGVGSCFDGSSVQCTTTHPGYCAYHSGFFTPDQEPILYAIEPYDGTIAGCDPGSSPNGDAAADAEINTISHEHNEAITDPTGTAWWVDDGSGDEIGDLCAWTFGTPISGTVSAEDAYNQVIDGHHYWLQQEYSNDGSACVQHYLGIPVNFGVAAVSGTAAEGQALSATQGTWSQSPTSYTYQWLRCSSASEASCLPFPEGTGTTYQLTATDAGQIFRVAVSAGNAAGTSIPAVSAPTAVVVPMPAATSPPVVSGVAAVGKSLSATTGGWNTSASFAYQWQRCDSSGSGCSAIAGATSATYGASVADSGHTLEAVVTATNAAGSGRAASGATGIVVAHPASTNRPRISGKAKVGRRLWAGHGGWSGPAATYHFLWLRCSRSGIGCMPIKKAVRATYRLTGHDAGHRLRVRVTAANVAGSGAATSRATKRVAGLAR